MRPAKSGFHPTRYFPSITTTESILVSTCLGDNDSFNDSFEKPETPYCKIEMIQ